MSHFNRYAAVLRLFGLYNPLPSATLPSRNGTCALGDFLKNKFMEVKH